ncbi:hypothetical protein TELCIR_18475 [Teladorsagia circumcincta]|uniref:Uncharacterized protein n=1 Tax=Teladorsagia circumcincta TaxID=45464 RepID=A0A2G9TQ31_TELCI|nr:hypothetical protein TELCIR_18475 [Teladorsagia circumcincta]
MILSLIQPDPLDRPTTSQLMNDEKLLANTRDRMKLQSGPLDKDWDFEFEDEIHPPSLRFSKPRVPLRDLRRDDIADTVESVRTCLRFEDSSDDDSPSCRSEK